MATTSKLGRRGAVLLSLLLVPAGFVAACSSDNNNPTPPPPVYDLDSGSKTTQSDDAGSDGTTTLPTDASQSADAPVTTKDGAVVTDAASCESDSGCWSCTPGLTAEFLNQCTSSQCSPFSNATRLPNYDGGLPPLN